MPLRRRATRTHLEGAPPTLVPPANELERIIGDAIAMRARAAALSPWQLPIVAACRRLIADTVAQLPLIDTKDRQPWHTQPPIVTRPDPSEPRWQTLWRVVDNLTGHGYVWLLPTAWDAAGWPSALRVVDAPAGQPTWDEHGYLADVAVDGRRLTPGPDGIIWLPYEVAARGSAGQPPMARCWQVAENLAALFQMAGSYWEAGAPSYSVSVNARLSPDDAKRLKSQLLTAWARSHEPAVLDNGATLSPVGSSAVEAQLVDSISMANAEIARTFGVMPSLVNVAAGDSLTYSTTESEARKWLAYGLGSYLSRIEGAWSDLLPYGHQARFDSDELTRTDFSQRANAYNTAIEGGWMTPDEVRAREGLPPRPAGQLAGVAADPGGVP